MAWFTETPWPPIFICLAAAALAFLAWGNGRRRKMLGVGLAFVLCCPLLYAFERYHVTPPELVEQRLHELVDAVEADDVDKVLTYFAADNRGDRLLAKQGMGQVRIEGGVRVTDVQVRYAEGNRTTIVSHFRANGIGAWKSAGGSGRFATRWEISWKQSDGEWRIVKLQRIDPINGEHLSLMAPPE